MLWPSRLYSDDDDCCSNPSGAAVAFIMRQYSIELMID